MYTNNSQDYLAHFGIKGMRWGVRRFQNQDGTLTAEGKERYDTGNSENKKTTDKPESKSVSEMSDQELRDRINRLNMERQYKQLLDEASGVKVRDIPQQQSQNPQKQKSGKKGGKGILNRIFVATAVAVAADLVKDQYKKKADAWITKAAENKKREMAEAAKRSAKNAAARMARQGKKRTAEMMREAAVNRNILNMLRDRG